MRGSISQKDKNLEKSRKRGVVCLTKSAQPEPILVCFKFSIFTLVYGFTYSYWYRSDRWPTHPWTLANIHNKGVNRVKHFLANTHTVIGVHAVQNSLHNFRILLQTSFRFLQREERVWRTKVAAFLERKQLPVCRMAASLQLGSSNKTFFYSFTGKMSLHFGKSHGQMLPVVNRHPLKEFFGI